MSERTLAARPRSQEAPAASGGEQRHQAIERRTAAAEADYASLLNSRPAGRPPPQRAAGANRTGLPDRLKAGMESLSGFSLDDVRVHYNSSKPAQLKASAFAQGSEIHIGPGQERHLAHEAWHVVQQKQGRVRTTTQMKGDVALNDEPALEREADSMGARAAAREPASFPLRAGFGSSGPFPVQRKISYEKGPFRGKAQLRAALRAVFDRAAYAQIDQYIDAYTDVGGYPRYGGDVFQLIVKHLTEQEFRPSFAVHQSGSASRHGPQVPTRTDRSSADDPTAARTLFGMGSVTLARATLSSRTATRVFHDRNSEIGHAEDHLIDQLSDELRASGEDASTLRLNLTINNFFCSPETTTKTKQSKSCLVKVIELQKKFRFERFHVYFKNPYGGREHMDGSIRMLQAAGILVTSFTTSSKAPYPNPLLDPGSDAEGADSRSPAEEKQSEGADSQSPAEERRSRRRPPGRGEGSRPDSSRSRSRRGRNPPERSRSRSRSRDPDRDGGDRFGAGGSPPGRRGRSRQRLDDEVTDGGRRYAPNVRGIRGGGHCFWDCMRAAGISDDHLAQAAIASGIAMGQSVYTDTLANFLNHLATATGATYRLNLVTFIYGRSRASSRQSFGRGTVAINLAIFMTPGTGEGHYVPALD